MDFPTAHLSSPIRRFPFQRCAVMLPCHGTRLPLSPHCSPSGVPAKRDSLGDFHPGVTPFLILFCRKNFKERSYFALGRSLYVVLLSEFPTQGRLRCTQRSRHKGRVAPQCRFISRPVPKSIPETGSPLRHSNESPQKQGRFPHAIRGRPESAGAAFAFASLQHPPQTGRKKQAPKASQLCPLKDF